MRRPRLGTEPLLHRRPAGHPPAPRRSLHLYVLIPVLDDDKHYWVGPDEVEKLLRRGEGWLAAHPLRDLIAHRYLKHQRSLAPAALARLRDEDGGPMRSSPSARARGGRLERLCPQRAAARRCSPRSRSGATASSTSAAARAVCSRSCSRSRRSRDRRRRRVAPRARARRGAARSSTGCRDAARADRPPARLADLPRRAPRGLRRRRRRRGDRAPRSAPPGGLRARRVRVRAPGTVVVTTPNAEYNVQFEALARRATSATAIIASSGRAREFAALGRARSARRFGYAVRFLPVGPEDATRRRADADGGVHADDSLNDVPELSLVVLIGPSGSGKSTFAPKHFKPTEVLSSDFCRGLVSDDENDQRRRTTPSRCCTSSRAKRLAARPAHRGRRHQRPARERASRWWRWRASTTAAGGHRARPAGAPLPRAQPRSPADRDFGPHVVRNQSPAAAPLAARPGARGLPPRLTSSTARGGRGPATIERQPLWNNRSDEHGPFDIIGDVHGCCDELRRAARPARLRRDDRAGRADSDACTPPGRAQGGLPRRSGRPRPGHRRRAAAGDGHGRGRDARSACRAITTSSCCASCAARDVQITHGLAESLAQLERRDRRSSGEQAGGLPRRPRQPLRARRRQARRRPRRHEGGDAGARLRRRCATSRSTARRPARPTSSACRCATTGRPSTAARRWSSTATRRSPSRSGSTARSTSTPAASSAAG